MTLLIWKLFLLFCSPAASLLISSSSLHRSLYPQPQHCGENMLWWIRPYMSVHLHYMHSFQRVSPEKTCVASCEGHHHLHDHMMAEACWLLWIVVVHWSVLAAPQSCCETDVASSKVPLEILALQKSLDPMGSATHIAMECQPNAIHWRLGGLISLQRLWGSESPQNGRGPI